MELNRINGKVVFVFVLSFVFLCKNPWKWYYRIMIDRAYITHNAPRLRCATQLGEVSLEQRCTERVSSLPSSSTSPPDLFHSVIFKLVVFSHQTTLTRVTSLEAVHQTPCSSLWRHKSLRKIPFLTRATLPKLPSAISAAERCDWALCTWYYNRYMNSFPATATDNKTQIKSFLFAVILSLETHALLRRGWINKISVVLQNSVTVHAPPAQKQHFESISVVVTVRLIIPRLGVSLKWVQIIATYKRCIIL